MCFLFNYFDQAINFVREEMFENRQENYEVIDGQRLSIEKIYRNFIEYVN